MARELASLLEDVQVFCSALGPFEDYDVREERETKWLRSLSGEEAESLLTWAMSPVLPSHWVCADDRFQGAMCEYIAQAAGRVFQVTHDSTILEQLARMLENAETREAALLGLGESGSRAVEPIISSWWDEDEVDIAYAVVSAIQKCGSIVSVPILQRLKAKWVAIPLLSGVIDETIEMLTTAGGSKGWRIKGVRTR